MHSFSPVCLSVLFRGEVVSKAAALGGGGHDLQGGEILPLYWGFAHPWTRMEEDAGDFRKPSRHLRTLESVSSQPVARAPTRRGTALI